MSNFKKIFPNSDDAKLIRGTKGRVGLIDLYVRNSRNKTEPSYLVITKEDDKLVFTFKNSETNEVINIVKE